MWKWKGGMRLGLYRLFRSCLLFQSAIKRETPFIVTVNKTIKGRSSRVLGKISFQGSAYQRSWKVWKDCEGLQQDATFPHLHPRSAACLSPKPHYCSKSHALHPCHKINKSITFPHTHASLLSPHDIKSEEAFWIVGVLYNGNMARRLQTRVFLQYYYPSNSLSAYATSQYAECRLLYKIILGLRECLGFSSCKNTRNPIC